MVLLLEQDRAQAAMGFRAAGALVAALGLVLVFATIGNFASKGRGTLAPWDPPRHLVVSGVYRHVRNPMISGVILILVGESLFFASRRSRCWRPGSSRSTPCSSPCMRSGS